MAPMTRRVFAAFRPCGGLNAFTPFEIASTPVSAAAPEENARRRTSTPTVASSGDEWIGNVRLRARAGSALADARADQCEHRDDEGICGQCEEDSRLAHAAEVHDGEQEDEEQRKAHLVRGERRHGGGQGEDTSRDRNGNGEDVVDEQRRGGDEARQGPEVLFRDDICPAARLVRLDGLDVGEHDDREHCRDGQRDRQDEVGGCRATRRREPRAPLPWRTQPRRAGPRRRSAAPGSSRAAFRGCSPVARGGPTTTLFRESRRSRRSAKAESAPPLRSCRSMSSSLPVLVLEASDAESARRPRLGISRTS